MARLRLFFCSDIHGSDVCFKKFVNAAEAYKADVLIVGGDITGKFIVPIFEEQGGRYAYSFLGEQRRVEEAGLGEALKLIRDTGSYPYVTSKERWEELTSSPTRMEELFLTLIRDSLRSWAGFAELRLRGRPVQCYIMPGNDDHPLVDEMLKGSEVIINPHERVVELSSGLKLLGLGYSNITPWKCYRDVPEELIERKIEQLMGEVAEGEGLLYAIHVPPFNSGIDAAPELDEQMRPKLAPGGQALLRPVGSTSVRRAIERHQPALGLHGHVHEARGFARIGRTLCFNPGSEYQEGVLRGVLIQLEDGKVRDFIFTAG
ncbi:MAG: metallophosphoesterase [Nitrososphaerota archaeon]